MARTVRNHPVPRDKMQEERGAEQIPEVKTQEILDYIFDCQKKTAENIIKIR